MIDDKRSFIVKLNIDGLAELMLNLLPNMDFHSVRLVSANLIEAKVNAGKAVLFTNCFILYSNQLTKGYSDTSILVDTINKKLNSGYAKVYLVNNLPISNGF